MEAEVDHNRLSWLAVGVMSLSVSRPQERETDCGLEALEGT